MKNLQWCLLLLTAGFHPGARAAELAVNWALSPAEQRPSYYVYYATFSLAGFTPAQAAALPDVSRVFRYTGDPYDYPLGPMPSGPSGTMPTPARPARPVITREVAAANAPQFNAAVAVAGTRVRVTADITGTVQMNDVTDIEVIMDPGARVQHLVINGGQRFRLSRGEYAGILIDGGISQPSDIMIHDAHIEDLSDPSSSPWVGVYVQGGPISLVRNVIRTTDSSIFGGESAASGIQDLIVAGNVIISEGYTPSGQGIAAEPGNFAHATFRVHYLTRSALVDNYFQNSIDGWVPIPSGSATQANYRVHGVSDDNYYARNVAVNSGTQIAEALQDGENTCGEFYYNDNIFFYASGRVSWGAAAGDEHYVQYIQARNNLVFSNSAFTCILCGDVPLSWEESGTRRFTARESPPPLWHNGAPDEASFTADLWPFREAQWPTETYHFRLTGVEANGTETGFLGSEILRTASSGGGGDVIPPSAPQGLRAR